MDFSDEKALFRHCVRFYVIPGSQDLLPGTGLAFLSLLLDARCHPLRVSECDSDRMTMFLLC